MNKAKPFQCNLLALDTRNPHLASRVKQADSNRDLNFIAAKTGSLVPVLQKAGRPFLLHSRFNPESEGQRLADRTPKGYLIAFGLGGAYHLMPLLCRNTTTALIIIENDITIFRKILEEIDLTSLLSDSRVVMLIDPSPQALVQTVQDQYLPLLYGDLNSIVLRARWDSNPDWFSTRSKALQELPASLERDYTVQTRFGKRWFAHTLANLPRSEQVHAILPPAKRVLITAAGPSLESQIPRIKDLKNNAYVILATDTSLPMLLSAKIFPDIVLSIDCQIVSYHHFLKGLPRKTTLILDLASPPLLSRLTDRVLFFSSGHPFSLYINSFYRPFPTFDLSGGNVTHAAMSVAQALSANEVHLFGADFSYPQGRPYSRGTYIFPHFQSQSSCISAAENSFWKFIAKSRPRREGSKKFWRWRTATLDHYHQALEKTVNQMNFQLISENGKGVEIRQNPARSVMANRKNNETASILSAGPPKSGWNAFLGDYRKKLHSLPTLQGSPQEYLANLDTVNRQAWSTLLPSAASFRANNTDGFGAVEEARHWAMEKIHTVQLRHQDNRVE